MNYRKNRIEKCYEMSKIRWQIYFISSLSFHPWLVPRHMSNRYEKIKAFCKYFHGSFGFQCVKFKKDWIEYDILWNNSWNKRFGLDYVSSFLVRNKESRNLMTRNLDKENKEFTSIKKGFFKAKIELLEGKNTKIWYLKNIYA